MSREEITQTYSLNCTRCGEVFESLIAFPEPHICQNCIKREGIREGIDRIGAEWFASNFMPAERSFAGDILEFLDSQDVAIKVEGEEPVEVGLEGGTFDILSAGHRLAAWEPLIEGEK